MTDNENVEALSRYLTGAKKCGSVTLGKEEMVELCDFFNRQNAEIERLRKENERFADIGKMYSEIRAEAKSEAYREFAERLKKSPSVTNCESEWLYLDIDNLLKELTRNLHGKQ